MVPKVDTFFDKRTSNACHIVSCPETNRAAVIDSVLGYDAASGRTDTDHADSVIAHIRDNGLTVDWILETHVHADHLTAAPYLKGELGGQTGIGSGIRDVQKTFCALFNADDCVTDGSQFDHLFADGESFQIGNLEAEVLHTPGHTPACVTYHIGDCVFTGDTLFMPDSGSARCDFPGGDAHQLYRSIQRILALPPETRMFINHDYGAGGKRDHAWETTVGEQNSANTHVGGGTSEDDYVTMRQERDATLAVPALLMPSVQVNMRAGALPPPENNGTRYLKIPIDAV